MIELDGNGMKKIIEINGVKMVVDLSTARVIDTYKIGDNVKVLKKEYGDKYNIYPGVIVSFVNFQELPTIQIAILKQEYLGTTIEFINFNSNTEGVEIHPCSEHELHLEKNSVMDTFNRLIEQKRHEMEELIAKRDWFEKYFAKYFNNC